MVTGVNRLRLLFLRCHARVSLRLLALLLVVHTCVGCAARTAPPSAEDEEVNKILEACAAVGKEVSARSRPAGLPSDWDKRIPIPAGATVTHVGDLDGVVRNVDFAVPGDYRGASQFYTNELKQAGFDLGKPVATSGGFSLAFSTCGASDTVSAYPDRDNPSKSLVRIVYEPHRAAVATQGTAVWLQRRREYRQQRERGGQFGPTP